MLTIVLQGQANLNVCTNKLAHSLQLLSSIKDENDNDAVAMRLFRKRYLTLPSERKQSTCTDLGVPLDRFVFIIPVYTLFI